MESLTTNLQEKLEQVFAQKALSKRGPRLEYMSMGELLYFALVESAEKGLIAQA